MMGKFVSPNASPSVGAQLPSGTPGGCWMRCAQVMALRAAAFANGIMAAGEGDEGSGGCAAAEAAAHSAGAAPEVLG